MTFGIVSFSVFVIACIVGIVDSVKNGDRTAVFGCAGMCVLCAVCLYFFVDTAMKGNTDVVTYEFSSTQYDWYVVEHVEPKLVVVDSVPSIQYDTTKILLVSGEEKSISINDEPGKKVTYELLDKRKNH